jgi:competence protein ComEC
MVISFFKQGLDNYLSFPLFCTALSAAIGFYLLSSAHIIVIIIVLLFSFVVLCLFRVLVSFYDQFKFKIQINDDNSRKFRLISICCNAFIIGIVLGLCASESGQNKVKFGIPQENITGINGILLEDPRVIPTGTVMVSMSLLRCYGVFGSTENVQADSSGEITLFFTEENTVRLREFGRGTQIFAEGILRYNERGFSFSANSLHIVKPAPPIQRMRTGIRLNLVSRFENLPKGGGLALALLVGIRDNLDNNLTSLYRDAGLSYILALSGMHLAIITAIIAFLLKKPLGLKAASIVGAVIIIIYCLLVGPMPSLIRSAFMYLLGVITILGSLPKKSMSILSLSFLIQLIITPAAGNSLSFILSYMALLGILITSRQLSSLLKGIIPDFLLNPLSLSCGAFLATAGICIYSFGRIAPVGIIAGLFIIPLTTIFMTGSILFLVLDLFSISFILNLPLSYLYSLMEVVTSIAGNVPGITYNPFIVLLFSFALLVLIAVFVYRCRAGLLKLNPFL